MKYQYCIFSVLFIFLVFLSELAGAEMTSNGRTLISLGTGINTFDGLPENWTTYELGGHLDLSARFIFNNDFGIGASYFLSPDRGHDDDDGFEEYAVDLGVTGVYVELLYILNRGKIVSPYAVFTYGEVKYDINVSQGGGTLENLTAKENAMGGGIGLYVGGLSNLNTNIFGNFELKYITFSDSEDLSQVQYNFRFGYAF